MKKIHKGFTLVEIMIVVAIIGLLVAIALPNFLIARKKAQMNTCKSNLKQLDGAVQQYLLDTPNAVIDNTLVNTNSTPLVPSFIKTFPVCPAYGLYTLVSSNIVCATGGAATDYPHKL